MKKVISIFLGFSFLFFPVNTFAKEKSELQRVKVNLAFVYDADTVYVWLDKKLEAVRLIGIDAPEKESKYRKGECFSKEANLFVASFLKGQKLTLLRDKFTSNRDKYGRLLRYVHARKKDLGRILIKQGMSDLFYKKHKKYGRYKLYLKKAQRQQKGMWGVSCHSEMISKKTEVFNMY